MFFRLWARAPSTRMAVLQVVGSRSFYANGWRSRLAPILRNLNAQLVVEIPAGEGRRHLLQLFIRGRSDDLPTVFASAGTQIEDVIGSTHHVGIVLHHQNGISQIAQFMQDVDQPRRIAAMQADGGFVEHVERADQARAQRGGQLDSLRFAAGERGGQAVQRQVLQADVVQEFQPFLDFFQDLSGNLRPFTGKLHIVEELCRLFYGE